MQLHHYIGSSLSRCTFSGQQCCSEQTLNFFVRFVGPVIEGDTFDFDDAFNGARSAMERLRNETGGTLIS